MMYERDRGPVYRPSLLGGEIENSFVGAPPPNNCAIYRVIFEGPYRFVTCLPQEGTAGLTLASSSSAKDAGARSFADWC
jgi:hypothetical protein